jgi:hypothetical protein
VNRSGQSTVEPMLAITALLLALVFGAAVFHPQFQALVGAIFDWVGTKVDIP